jgi:flagella basal body P-ring formation protein FlgA
VNLEGKRQEGATIRIWAAWAAAAAFFGGVAASFAGDHRPAIAEEIGSRYPGARIEITEIAMEGAPVETPVTVTPLLMDEDGKGSARYRIGGQIATVSYHAWVTAPIALRRIRPGERLEKSLFVQKEIDVSRGIAREFRGIMIPRNTDLASLEARNTILEGAYPTTSGVVTIPDVRRGDAVKVRLLSGGLALVTQGIAQESAYLGRQVRVIASSTKAEVTGTLGENRTVEVHP